MFAKQMAFFDLTLPTHFFRFMFVSTSASRRHTLTSCYNMKWEQHPNLLK